MSENRCARRSSGHGLWSVIEVAMSYTGPLPSTGLGHYQPIGRGANGGTIGARPFDTSPTGAHRDTQANKTHIDGGIDRLASIQSDRLADSKVTARRSIRAEDIERVRTRSLAR